jgi:uncharacterized protein (TIGR02118 family)
MVKVTVLYGKPLNPDAFEKYYAETHMSIVRRAGLQRTEAARVVGTTDGSEPQFYRTFDIWMDDMEQLQLAMGSPEVVAMREDLKNFATGGVSILVSTTEPQTSETLGTPATVGSVADKQ